MKDNRAVKVVFVDSKLQKEYDRIKSRYPDLYRFLDRAFDDIKTDPECGIAITQKPYSKSLY